MLRKGRIPFHQHSRKNHRRFIQIVLLLFGLAWLVVVLPTGFLSSLFRFFTFSSSSTSSTSSDTAPIQVVIKFSCKELGQSIAADEEFKLALRRNSNSAAISSSLAATCGFPLPVRLVDEDGGNY